MFIPDCSRSWPKADAVRATNSRQNIADFDMFDKPAFVIDLYPAFFVHIRSAERCLRGAKGDKVARRLGRLEKYGRINFTAV